MGDETARHRRNGRDDDLTATALRRLQVTTPPNARGWVPPPLGPSGVLPGSAMPDATNPPGPLDARVLPDATDAPSASAPLDALLAPPGTGAPLGARAGPLDGSEPLASRLRAARLAPTGRAVRGLVLLVGLAVVTAFVALWLARPREQPLPPRTTTLGAPLETGSLASAAGPGATSGPGATPGPAATPGAGATVGAAATVLVHVVGAVRHPGVVELSPGSRVTDAVEAAGGVTRNAATASVNLARPVVDGEQVVVLRRGDRSALAAPGVPGVATGTSGQVGSSAAGTAASGPVDLNTATMEQLDTLPGIGPVLAQRILDWRTLHGRFSTVDELGEVSGIGEATLADLRPVVRV